LSGGVALGVTGILATPFAPDDSIDHDALARQVEATLAWGSTAVGFGFASEVHRMTEAERDAAVGTAAAAAPEGTPVMAHVWAGSVTALERRLVDAAEAGATVAMVPAPPVVALDDAATEAFFTAGADAGVVPIVVQDAPALTGVAISARLLAELLGHPRVAAVKVEAVPSAPKVGAVAEAVGGASGVLGGGGGFDFLHELQRGASGTMPGAALPEPFARVLKLHGEGETERARAAFHRILPLLAVSQRSFDTYVGLQKQILVQRGVIASARLRAPCEAPDPGLAAELDEIWPVVDELLAEPAP
jgi:dihydrodipicolinate synthase/N-acetylneuraminate lyase